MRRFFMLWVTREMHEQHPALRVGVGLPQHRGTPSPLRGGGYMQYGGRFFPLAAQPNAGKKPATVPRRSLGVVIPPPGMHCAA